MATVPAMADILYDNGPVNGQVNAWTISPGFSVGDTFTVSSTKCPSGCAIQGFGVYIWEFPGDSAFQLSWSITSDFGGGIVSGIGTVYAPGYLKDTYKFTNNYGMEIHLWEATLGTDQEGVFLLPATYWLNLYNAVGTLDTWLFWDENSGVGCGGERCPSLAKDSDGTVISDIPSEAFSVTGTPTAEPGTILLFGSGVLGFGAVLRRKLF